MLLGLAAALSWGTADFWAGLQARRLSAFAVTLWSQAAGACAVGLAVALGHESLQPAPLLWGLAAGVADGVALLLFYRGLATGLMALVAPVAACGALVPVVAALLRGQTPGLVASVGLGATVSGLLLLSAPRGGLGPARPQARRALLLALGAALGYGTFLLLVGQAADLSGHVPLWTVAGVRLGTLVLLAVLARVGPFDPRWPGRRLAPVAALGLLDALGLLCFALAAGRGNVGIAAVLSSLGPAVTVVLGRLVLGERVSRVQGGGIFLAMCGVLLLAAS